MENLKKTLKSQRLFMTQPTQMAAKFHFILFHNGDNHGTSNRTNIWIWLGHRNKKTKLKKRTITSNFINAFDKSKDVAVKIKQTQGHHQTPTEKMKNAARRKRRLGKKKSYGNTSLVILFKSKRCSLFLNKFKEVSQRIDSGRLFHSLAPL